MNLNKVAGWGAIVAGVLTAISFLADQLADFIGRVLPVQ